MRLSIVAALLALPLQTVQAAEPGNPRDLSAPPPLVKDYKSPDPAAAETHDSETIPEPEITITTKGEERHEEYRIGGRLYMVKVTPKNGRPYYLIDKEGHGEFVKDDFQSKLSPPMWVIKRF